MNERIAGKEKALKGKLNSFQRRVQCSESVPANNLFHVSFSQLS
jgi:hypothetical protein